MARRDWIVACAIFAAAITIRLALLHAPVHDYDEGVYWQSLLAMHDGYALYRDIFDSQPPLFLDITYLFFVALGKSLMAARIAGAIASVVCVASGAWIAYRIGGRIAGVAALTFLAIDNVDLAEALTLQAEALAVGLATLSVALVMESTLRPRNSVAIAMAAGAFAAAATLVKLLAITCVVPFFVWVLWKRDLRAVGAYVAGALAVTVISIAPHAASLHQMFAQTIAFHLTAADFPISRYSTIASGLQLPFVLLTLAGTALAVSRKNIYAVGIATWLAIDLLMFFKITPLFPHHIDAIQAPMIVLAAYAVGQVAKADRARVTVAAIVVVVVSVELWYVSASVHRMLHPPNAPRLSASDLARAVPRNGWVITDLQATAATAGFQTPPVLVDTSLVRIRSGNLTSAALIEAANDPRVNAVVFGGRRLTLPQVHAFSTWVHVHFHSTPFAGIWIR